MSVAYDYILGRLRLGEIGSSGGVGGFLGYFATESALTTAYPTANDGDYAIVGSTDTVWVWDTDTTAWVDSGATPSGTVGANGDIQFNTGGAHDADADLNWDKTAKQLLVNGELRLAPLNTGDQVITTTTDGDLQESGVSVETAPAGGSGIVVQEYASAPVTPPTGMLWIQAKDATTKTLNYYDGTDTFSVDLSI